MQNKLSPLIFVAIPVVAGGLIGAATAPGAWYGALVKPSFNPPGWIFGPVWTVLYVMIGVAGWLVWRRAKQSAAMVLWIVQLALNWMWSPVFFSLHAPSAAAVIILALLAVILAFTAAARKVDSRASWLFVPYAAWVTFASVLNIAIAVLN